MSPDPQIAEQFVHRLQGTSPGWEPVPCDQREAKVTALDELIPLVQRLGTRVRRFETPAPPLLNQEVMKISLLGQASDYRCVVQDYREVDVETGPNFQAGLGHLANLYWLKAQQLLAAGQRDAAYAHVLEALELYREPIGPMLGQQLKLPQLLKAIQKLLERSSPDVQMLERMAQAVDRTIIAAPVVCGAIRHELLTQAVAGFRVHLRRRERQAIARRFGVGYAKLMWRSPLPGTLDRAVWGRWAVVYDAVIGRCGQGPVAQAVKAAQEPLKRLRELHPPTAAGTVSVIERFQSYRALVDRQLVMLIALRAMAMKGRLGRPPTTAELAGAWGRVPINPWDGAKAVAVMEGERLMVRRGGYRVELELPGSDRTGVGS